MDDNRRHGRPTLAILGIRGVPAEHGGFETFAARLAPYLANANWDVSVYCQESSLDADRLTGRGCWQSTWENVTRIHIGIPSDTAFNSILFDWRCVDHVLETRPQMVLILGYNTALFALRLRLAGISIVINMDGLEWQRAKWGPFAKAWLYVNERVGCRVAHHLIADHPQIGQHLQRRTDASRITVIPYGSDLIERREEVSVLLQNEVLQRLGLVSKRFVTVISRAEPENSILEIVRAFSRKERGLRLVVLGRYHPDKVKYHADVLAAASSEVAFPGAIYDKTAVETLRRHGLFYIHGHQVGGTNPSLLEAMGAGNPVVAHDNRFNRWVARDGALYFSNEQDCERAIEEYLRNPQLLERHGQLNRSRAEAVFNWNEVLQSYSELLGAVGAQVGAAAESRWGRRKQWGLDAAS